MGRKHCLRFAAQGCSKGILCVAFQDPMSVPIVGDNRRALIDLDIAHECKRQASAGKAHVSSSEARHNVGLAESYCID